jgi:cytochrome c oxidase assembly protein subunit 15
LKELAPACHVGQAVATRLIEGFFRLASTAMTNLRFGVRPYPLTQEMRWRHRFSLLTACTTVALMAWGAFVTSIDAGLAVPDWPTSFNSYDPFNPWPAWWTLTPVLAEHGHRLLGALVGLFTLTLAVWTWRRDPRGWMRKLGLAALLLVIVQGVLGGLRVVWISLDLAVVHACMAQLFFSTIVAMALFTSPGWLRAESIPPADAHGGRLVRLVLLTALVLYGQIILGALLRHPGTGIDPALAAFHTAGAFVVTGCVVGTVAYIRVLFARLPLLSRASWLMLGALVVQVLLGITAYFVTLDETGMVRPSNVQVIVNSSHMVVGALLMASTVATALLSLRRPAGDTGDALTREPVLVHRTPAPAAP